MPSDNKQTSGFIHRILYRVFAVQRGEWLIFSFMSAYIFFTISSYLIIKSVGRSMFLNKVGSQQLPYVYILVAVIVGIIASVYGRFSKKTPLLKLILFSHGFLLMNMVVFWLFFTADVRAPWLFYTFYIWMSIFGVLVPSQFWLLANHVYDPREAKRIFGPLAGMAIAGGICGGYFVQLTVHLFGTQNMLLANILLQILLGALLFLIWRKVKLSHKPSIRRRGQAGGTQKKSSFLDMFQEILGMKHLRLLMAVIGTTVVVVQLADYQFNSIASATYTDQNDLTAFLGFWQSNLSVISILIQFLFAQHILRRFGLTVAICALPMGLALGNMGLLIYPTIYAATILKVSDGAFRYSLNKSGVELLYLPLPTGLKDRTKTFIDMFVDRAGRGISGIILILAGVVLHLTISEISFIAIAIIGLWLFLIFKIRREYVNTFRKSLAKRTLDPDQLRLKIDDGSNIAVLLNTLDGDDPGQIVFALELLTEARKVNLSSRLKRLVAHSSPRIREKVYHIAGKFKDPSLVDHVTDHLCEETDINVYQQGLKYLSTLAPDECRNFIVQEIKKPENPRQIWAARFLVSCSEKQMFQNILSEDFIEPLLEQEDTHSRWAGAILLSLMTDGTLLSKNKERLLADSSTDIRQATVQAMGQTQKRDFIPDLLNALKNRDTKHYAVEALGRYGDRIEGTLRDYILDPDESMSLRLAIPKLLETMGSPGAVHILDDALDVETDILRYRALKSLNRLKKRLNQPILDSRRIDDLLTTEAVFYFNLLESEKQLEADPRFSGNSLLSAAFSDQRNWSREMLFRILGLQYSSRDILSSYQGVTSANRRKKASALEFLDNILHRHVKDIIFTVIDDIPFEKKLSQARLMPGFIEGGLHLQLEGILNSSANFLKSCILYCFALDERTGFEVKAQELVNAPTQIVREASVRYLEALGLKEKDNAMYTIIEKVMILQSVDFFNRCTTQELAEIAAIAEELEFESDQIIFREGDPNDALYVVLTGSVRMEMKGDRMATVEQKNAFGVWSLFDDEPRIATAIANEQTRLLRLDREDFFELLSEQFDITQKIFQSIVGRLKLLIK